MSEMSIIILSLSGMATFCWIAWLVYKDSVSENESKPKK